MTARRKKMGRGRRLAAGLGLVALLFASPAFGVSLSVTDSNFDQVAKINALGGTVTQIGGSVPGKVLTTAGGGGATNFAGSVDASSGVSVTLPGWVFASSAPSFNSNTSGQPGNTADFRLGAPTDIGYTSAGAGGPDGGAGDGSVEIKEGGGVTLTFPGPVSAPAGFANDLFIFADIADSTAPTTTLIELLNGAVVLASLTTSIPASTTTRGIGGVLLNVTDGTIYTGVRLTVVQDPTQPSSTTSIIEIDAVAANVVPEPATFLLLGSGLAGLWGLAWRRRRGGCSR